MKALVVTCRDPFRPANQRSAVVVRRRRSLRNLAPRTRAPVICQVNGQWISRKAWAMRVKDGDSVVFVTLPQGGGGGGSNPLKMILMLAVAYFAPYLATQMLGINGAAAIGSLGVSLVTGAIGLVGNMLVNALIPAPKPPQAQQAASLAAASPTYSIGAQGNAARLGQPIPVIYGRHQVFPDFAAMPYTEYGGNEQYLYQLFCIGQGEYDIEAIRVEDTPISSFSEITYEVIPPGGTVTLFPTSVTTSGEVAGQEALTGTALGPFVANAAGSLANYLSIDVVASRGLYYANDGGGLDAVGMTWKAEAQLIDDVGAALGSWFTLGNESLSAATTTPQRMSYKYAVPSGRYQVRLTRTDAKQTASRYGHELDWAGLRAYLPGTQNYGNVTLVAMKLRATNNLSAQASRKINMIVQRKLKTWHPVTGWSATAVPTQSIAWALADICRADYGAGLSSSRINLAGLHALDAVWTARGDTFNAVYDTQGTIMEGLTLTGRAGRAIPFVQGGVVHVVRDQAATLPVAMFSQRNIVKGSLKIDFLMASEDTADCVDVTYFDAAVWSERTVRATLPGGTSVKPAKVKLFGVTNRQQAWNEGMYTAACNRYRRRLPTFATEMEGFIPTLGDLIGVQHDMPKWGQHGEIVAWNAATKEAILSEPLDWSAGGPHVLAFRGRDGKPRGPYATTAGTDAHRVILSDWALSGAHWDDGTSDKATPDIGGDRERSHFAFGPANQQYIKCRMVAMRPKSGGETVEIAAVVESDYVHTADTGVAPTAADWQLPGTVTSPVIEDLVCRFMQGTRDKMVISWQPAAGADHYLIEQGNGDGSWTHVGNPSSPHYTAVPLFGEATIVRVAAVGFTRGAWVMAAISTTGSEFAPAAVSGFSLSYTAGLITLSWTPNAETNIKYYEGRVGSAWVGGTRVGRGLTSITHRITAPGTYTFWLAATNDLEFTSTPVSQSITVNVPALLTGISVTPGILNGYFQCTMPTEKDFSGIRIWLDTSPSFTPSDAKLVYDGPNTATVINKTGASQPLVAGTTYYLKAAAYSLIKTGLLVSADYSFVPSAAGGVPVFATVAALPASPADGTVASVTADNKLYRYDTATGWVTWVDGSDIINASVTAGKITTSNLAAISANLGAITAGSMTLNAAGFVKAGSSDYATGTGFWLGYASGAYRFSLGNYAGAKYIVWDGSDLYIKSPQFTLSAGSATFSGALSAASGSFAGAVNTGAYTGYGWPAAGTFGAHLSASGLLIGNANNGHYFQVDSYGNIYAPNFSIVWGVLTISQANVINTLNIAGNAVTIPVSATASSGEVSVGISSGGGTIQAIATAQVNINVQYQDGSEIWQTSMVYLTCNGAVVASRSFSSLGGSFSFAASHSHAPGTGGYTYRLYNTNAGYLTGANICLLETKR